MSARLGVGGLSHVYRTTVHEEGYMLAPQHRHAALAAGAALLLLGGPGLSQTLKTGNAADVTRRTDFRDLGHAPVSTRDRLPPVSFVTAVISACFICEGIVPWVRVKSSAATSVVGFAASAT